MIFRIILIFCLSGFAVFLIRSRGLRSRAWSLLLLCVLIGLGVVAVVAPELTTVVANAVGVGRGADLLIYLLIVTLFFVILMMFARIRTLQDQITRLAREMSIEEAVQTKKAAHNGSGNQDGNT